MITVIGVTRDAWDGLVGSGSVGLVFDVQRMYSLVSLLGELRTVSGWCGTADLDVEESIADAGSTVAVVVGPAGDASSNDGISDTGTRR
ncbi:MAG: hypothetical protein ACRDRH_29985 [Pseudonocardia sp.]